MKKLSKNQIKMTAKGGLCVGLAGCLVLSNLPANAKKTDDSKNIYASVDKKKDNDKKETGSGKVKSIEKQESVYVNAKSDGSVDTVTVSDILKNAGKYSGQIKDNSDLSDIINVKGDEEFSQNGDKIEWNANGDNIYYQGKTDKEIPVGVSIAYKLDGKEMKAEDMLGKSGKVEIAVSYTNKSYSEKEVNGKKVKIYTPFIIMTGMILSSDTFSNIEIDNGKIVDDGSKCIAVGMGFPGLAESLELEEDKKENIPVSFTITADVTDFSIGETYTIANANVFNDIDLDDINEIDDLEDKLDDLTDAANKLVDGADELNTGADEFSGKMDELKSSMKKYNDEGIKKITSGINTLASNGETLVTGVNKYTSGVVSLASGTKKYVKGAKQIANGNNKLYNAVKDLPSQIDVFNKGIATYTGAVDKMASTDNMTALKDGADKLSAGVDEINQGLVSLENSYSNNEAVIDTLNKTAQALEEAGDKEKAEIIRQSVAALSAIAEQQKEGIRGLESATSSEGALQSGISSMNAGVSQVMYGLVALSGKSNELTSASSKINDSIPTLVESAKKLKNGGANLVANNDKLTEGANSLIDSSKTMKSSAKKLNEGMQQLDKGSDNLVSSTNKLSDGIEKLTSASVELFDGTDKLASGTGEFKKKGIDKLNEIYEDDVKKLVNRLKVIKEAGEDYMRFSGIGNSMTGKVNFIIKTEAVEKEE